MKIRDIFGQGDVSQSTQAAQERRKTNLAHAKDQEVFKEGEDRVSISPLARQFATISQILSEDASDRKNKVDQLKQQVEGGTYGVAKEDIAKSLLDYIKR